MECRPWILKLCWPFIVVILILLVTILAIRQAIINAWTSFFETFEAFPLTGKLLKQSFHHVYSRKRIP